MAAEAREGELILLEGKLSKRGSLGLEKIYNLDRRSRKKCKEMTLEKHLACIKPENFACSYREAVRSCHVSKESVSLKPNATRCDLGVCLLTTLRAFREVSTK